jgi:hypothetical protein
MLIFLFITAKKNSTRIARTIEGTTISVTGLSNVYVCSTYSYTRKITNKENAITAYNRFFKCVFLYAEKDKAKSSAANTAPPT